MMPIVPQSMAEMALVLSTAAASRAEAPDHSTTLDDAGIGEWDADLISGEVRFSSVLHRLLGLPEDQPATIADVRASYHPEDRARVSTEMAKAFADPRQSLFRNSFRICGADAKITWLEARGTIFRDASGKPVRSVGVMLDVTDAKLREQVLERSWRRFSQALANTAIVLFEQDGELRYTWIHNSLLGSEAHSVIGKTDEDLLPPELARPLVAAKRRVLETGRTRHLEVDALGPGGLGTYDLHIEPLQDETGAVVGIACAAIALGQGAQNAMPLPAPRRTIEDRDVLLDRIGSTLDPRLRHRGIPPICATALQRKLMSSANLSADECRNLAALTSQSRYCPAKKSLDIGTDGPGVNLVGSGWAYSYELLADGARQVIAFHLPGDFIGYHDRQAASGNRCHAAISECVLCAIDEPLLETFLDSTRPLGKALRATIEREEAIIAQHLVSIGRRSAIARVAHLLLELGARLEAVQLADPDGFRCPLTQELIADAIGLTNIHVNRVLRRLKDQGLLTYKRGFVTFHDKDHLTALADFDPSYLQLRPASFDDLIA